MAFRLDIAGLDSALLECARWRENTNAAKALTGHFGGHHVHVDRAPHKCIRKGENHQQLFSNYYGTLKDVVVEM